MKQSDGGKPLVSVTVTIQLGPETLKKLDDAARAGLRSRNREVQRIVEMAMAIGETA